MRKEKKISLTANKKEISFVTVSIPGRNRRRERLLILPALSVAALLTCAACGARGAENVLMDFYNTQTSGYLTAEQLEQDSLEMEINDIISVDAYMTPLSYYENGVATWEPSYITYDEKQTDTAMATAGDASEAENGSSNDYSDSAGDAPEMEISSYYGYSDMEEADEILGTTTMASFTLAIDEFAQALGSTYVDAWEDVKSSVTGTDTADETAVTGTGAAEETNADTEDESGDEETDAAADELAETSTDETGTDEKAVFSCESLTRGIGITSADCWASSAKATVLNTALPGALKEFTFLSTDTVTGAVTQAVNSIYGDEDVADHYYLYCQKYKKYYMLRYYASILNIPIKEVNVYRHIEHGLMAEDSFGYEERYNSADSTEDYEFWVSEAEPIATAYITKDGFEFDFETELLYTGYGAPQEVITADDVLGKAVSALNAKILSYSGVTIKNIELTMALTTAQDEDGKYRVIYAPYWVLDYTYVLNGETCQGQMVWDACTGERADLQDASDYTLTAEEAAGDSIKLKVSDTLTIDAYITPSSDYEDGLAVWKPTEVVYEQDREKYTEYYDEQNFIFAGNLEADETVLGVDVTIAEFTEVMDEFVQALGDTYVSEWQAAKAGGKYTVTGGKFSTDKGISFETHYLDRRINIVTRNFWEKASFSYFMLADYGALSTEEKDFSFLPLETVKDAVIKMVTALNPDVSLRCEVMCQSEGYYEFKFYSAIEGIPEKNAQVHSSYTVSRLTEDSLNYWLAGWAAEDTYGTAESQEHTFARVFVSASGFCCDFDPEYEYTLFREAREVLSINDILPKVIAQLANTPYQTTVKNINLVMALTMGEDEEGNQCQVYAPYWVADYIYESGGATEQGQIAWDAYEGIDVSTRSETYECNETPIILGD
ncbi:MAG: hypothetical protein LUE29_14030 [Lachnospiraceae bacterium]|nr:hypothetical protein [Lachnospiraceae bacterium]